ncbi:MAG: hypothetical protein LBF27_30270 [Sphingobacterium sp.]|nr:hypothetical protein [Sphingobacterium sp.]
MYVAPSIKEHVIELEQGIAAGSGETGFSSPSATDVEDAAGGQNWDTNSF